MTFDQVVTEQIRVVVRQEIEAAFAAHSGGINSDAPLTYQQAAKFIGCHPATIASWRRRGLLPATGTGKMTRVLRADLLRVLEQQRAAPADTETPAETAARILNKGKR